MPVPLHGVRGRSTWVQAISVLSAFRDRLFHQGEAGAAEGERPSFDQRSADGFLDMCRAAAGGSVLTSSQEPTLPLDGLGPARPPATPKKVIVRIDFDALLRGYPAEGETCDIAGYGPVPVAAVRDMIATESPFLAAVATKGGWCPARASEPSSHPTTRGTPTTPPQPRPAERSCVPEVRG